MMFELLMLAGLVLAALVVFFAITVAMAAGREAPVPKGRSTKAPPVF
jgi:hypothetical protein